MAREKQPGLNLPRKKIKNLWKKTRKRNQRRAKEAKEAGQVKAPPPPPTPKGTKPPHGRSDTFKLTTPQLRRFGNGKVKTGVKVDLLKIAKRADRKEMLETDPKIPTEILHKSQYRKGTLSRLPVFIPFREDSPAPRYGMTKDLFLKKIGKTCSEYAEKFASWEDLMQSTGISLKKNEIPIKPRKWILRWIEKYKQGEEPKSIRFQSICKKNKEQREENKAKHRENFLKHKARVIMAKNERREEKRKLVRKNQRLSVLVDRIDREHEQFKLRQEGDQNEKKEEAVL